MHASAKTFYFLVAGRCRWHAVRAPGLRANGCEPKRSNDPRGAEARSSKNHRKQWTRGQRAQNNSRFFSNSGGLLLTLWGSCVVRLAQCWLWFGDNKVAALRQNRESIAAFLLSRGGVHSTNAMLHRGGHSSENPSRDCTTSSACTRRPERRGASTHALCPSRGASTHGSRSVANANSAVIPVVF